LSAVQFITGIGARAMGASTYEWMLAHIVALQDSSLDALHRARFDGEHYPDAPQCSAIH